MCTQVDIHIIVNRNWGEYTGNMGGAVEFWGWSQSFPQEEQIPASICGILKGNKQGGGAMKEIWTKG